jgi:DNA polymerase (family 10)
VFPTEASLYDKFGLQYIEPELREGYDEIERAADGTLATLVTAKEIRGELHAHSISSDGSNSIEEMAEAAQARGYEYTGITDHSQSLKIACGVSVDDLWGQIRQIDKLNERTRGFRILKSAEVDILADGSLDYPDDLLRELDCTVCSIHSRFGLARKEQTERILRAMDNRYFNILGHATGRLLLKRPGLRDRLRPHHRACPSEWLLFRDQFQSRPSRSFGPQRPACVGGRDCDRDFDRCPQHRRVWAGTLWDRPGSARGA